MTSSLLPWSFKISNEKNENEFENEFQKNVAEINILGGCIWQVIQETSDMNPSFP